jgi:hypothetical protein
VGNGVQVIDVSNPAASFSVADYFITPILSAYITDVTLIADHLYVATSVGGGDAGGLEVIDVSNPGQPTWAAALDMPDAGGIIPRSSYAYVLRSDRVTTLDVRNPASPQLVGTWGAGLVNPIVLFDHYAYMGSSIFGVSNPAQPVAVGTFEDSFAGKSYGVACNYLYSASRSGPLFWGVGSVGAFDMSNPLQPKRVGSFATFGNAQEVAVQGSYAYVADGWGLKVFEIGNPAKPVFLSGDYSITNENSNAFCVEVTGQYAYVAEWNRWSGGFRFHIMDVIDATAPLRVGGCDISMKPITDHEFAPQVRFVGANAYVVEPSTQWRITPSYLHILDLSNPTQPVLAGKCEIPGTVTAATVAGQEAYVAVAGSQGDLLQAYDLSDPALPRQLGMTNTADCGRDLCVVGRHAYVAITNFVEVFDVSNPTQPALISSCRVGTDARPVGIVNIASDGSYLYLSEQMRDWDDTTEWTSGRLGVFDLRNPANPIRVGGWTITDDHLMGRLTLAGNYAYVADGRWGFKVVRLRDLLTLNAPLLSPEGLALSWAGGPGIKLQKTTSLTNPNWRDVPGSEGVSQIELPCAEAAAFFRLVKP